MIPTAGRFAPSAGASDDCAWALSDGGRGNAVQAAALAGLTGLSVVEKVIAVRPPWSWLAPGLVWPGAVRHAEGAVLIAPPWPRMAIGCGRRVAAAVLAIKARSRGITRAVQILDPGGSRGRFDLIVAPRHDRVIGPNVLETLGSVSRITPARLAEAARGWATALCGLPRPRVAVLIGGNSRHHRLSSGRLDAMLAHLKRLAGSGAGLMVSVSRRTPRPLIDRLADGLAGLPHHLYRDAGPNPYEGYLALADHVLVTEDSVNMTTEAVSTGKPVQTIPLDGGSARLARFHAALQTDGYTRPFTGALEDWSPPVCDDRTRLAQAMRTVLEPR